MGLYKGLYVWNNVEQRVARTQMGEKLGISDTTPIYLSFFSVVFLFLSERERESRVILTSSLLSRIPFGDINQWFWIPLALVSMNKNNMTTVCSSFLCSAAWRWLTTP